MATGTELLHAEMRADGTLPCGHGLLPLAMLFLSTLFLASPIMAATKPSSDPTASAAAPAGWPTQVQQDLAAKEYEVSWQAAPATKGIDPSWQAPNRAQGFRTYFTPEGIRVVPRIETNSSWHWGLWLIGYGRGESSGTIPPPALSPSGRRIEYRRGAFTEFYENTPRGLEQGFVLQGPPGQDLETPSKSAAGDGINAAQPESQGSIHLDFALWGDLSPRLSADGQAIDLVTSSGAPGIHYGQMKVTDARGRMLSARMNGLSSQGGQGIRLVVDTREAAYPLTVDSLVTSAAWIAESNQAGARFAASVAAAGDVNGDGYSDVIVGAPLYDNGQTDEGRAFLYLGSPSGLSLMPAWSAESDQASAQFGASVATAGDVNDDGYDDVVVGAPLFDVTLIDEGRAFLFLGSASGPASTPAWTAESGKAGARFGAAIATAGDVNGDGYDDVVVGAPFFDGLNRVGEGQVYVFLGSASGLSSTPDQTKTTSTAGAHFGAAVGTAGDVNGDGYADLLIGSPQWGNINLSQIDRGRAYIYLGSASGPQATAVWTVTGSGDNVELGSSVSTAGDINGDGYADVLVGIPHLRINFVDEGGAGVYPGTATGVSTTAIKTFVGSTPGILLGISVSTAGDVNGDGYADVLIGALGQATVFLGSSAGIVSLPPLAVSSGQASDDFGSSVGTAGDVNGDGYSDIIVGAPRYDDGESDEGVAFLYLGSGLASGPGAGLNPGWGAEGNQPGAYFGSSMATAGDVNGDGFSDVIVGAYGYDTGVVDAGAVWVFLGSPSGLSTIPVWTVLGDQAGGFLGSSVASAGDLNGDGYSDVIVGAPFYDGGQTDEGRAYLYLGSAAGLSSTPAWTAERDQAGARFGTSVATAGDVNGDGYSDVIVGAPLYDNGQTDEGGAFLYLGSPAGLSSTPAWTAEGEKAGAGFGTTVANAGDVNGDGYSDVIIGAPFYDDGIFNQGRAQVYLGSVSGLLPTPAWVGEVATEADFGASVHTAGDVNGDGYSDVIVGAPTYGGSLPDEGRAFVYLGSASGLASMPAWFVGSDQQAELGTSVDTAGDVNGDGYSDVIVGAWAFDHGLSDEGRAYLYLGSAAGLSSTPAWTGYGIQAGGNYGHLVAAAGDVNGDGFADVLVDAPGFDDGETDEGIAYLYHGGGGDGLDRIPRQGRTDATSPVALRGKSDSPSGILLQERGITPAGRGNIRLQWEVKPLGAPFDGSALGASTVHDTGAPTGSGSATTFNELVASLGNATFYRWRARIVSSNPFFPRSPWMSLAGDNITEAKFRIAGCRDLDGDGYGAPSDDSCPFHTGDCNDSDASAWAPPGEALDLRFTSDTALAWDPPSSSGGLTSGLLYDMLRATTPGGFLSAGCLESDDGPNTTASEPSVPAIGQVYFYLVRAQNTCPVGQGPLGTDSLGAPRQGRSCP